MSMTWKVEEETLTIGSVREIKDYSQEDPPWADSIENIQRIVIGEGVEKISANAFAAFYRLEHIVIPASVNTIGDFAVSFCYCGDKRIDGGQNVVWSLDDGILLLKKNPAAKSNADFSTDMQCGTLPRKISRALKLSAASFPPEDFLSGLDGLVLICK